MQSNIRKALMDMQKVYNYLEDEESRITFKNKLMYEIGSADEKNIYLHKIWRFKEPERYARLEQACKSGKEIIVYGVGDYCYSVIQCCSWLGGVVSFLCDSNEEKHGKKGPLDIEIISPQKLFKEHTDAYVVISTLRAHKEVYDFLIKNMPEKNVIEFAIDIEVERIGEQYFDSGIMKYEDGEIFVDCGCYDFSTSIFLSEKCNVKKVYAFEPDSQNIPKIREGIKKTNIKDVEVYEKGVWNKNDKLYFRCTGDTMTSVVNSEEDATTTLEVVSLDDVIDGPVTYIKMDIEGSELKALEGAKRLIKQYKPKLAVSVYHRPEDIIELPLYIKTLVPEYKLYLRHYSNFDHETVLYALPF